MQYIIIENNGQWLQNLSSYFEIETPGHELMSNKWLIYLCHDTECILLKYFETLLKKGFQSYLVNGFINKNYITSELRLGDT